ncbi:helix-turn-helix transcriptional regulator [Paenibacillus thiaminolyticus]|uniref:helix-turn-helix domain-containing protein n=1 Tax=Paenibacillus thiaminolyticus TaxID=49283 RepID=UPI003D29E7B4
MNILGKRIKAERENKKKRDPKWTQDYVANLIGVARPTYTAYENGTKEPPLDTLNKIADLFDVSSDYLLGRTDLPSPSSNEEAELDALLRNHVHGAFFKDYLSAPEQKKEEMRQFLKFILDQEKNRKPGQRQGE